MNYKDPEHKEALIKFISDTLISFQKDLEAEAGTNQKRSALIAYWLRDYKNYLKQEKTFRPKSLPTYERGSIIEVNFGFNLGSELGGVHYAVVLTKNDNRNKSTLTVLPLSSVKPHKNFFRPYEIDLGNEIYNLMSLKLKQFLFEMLHELEGKMETEDIKQILDSIGKNILPRYVSSFDKIETLKEGSFAIISQITTISKMRIFDPLKSSSSLYGIKLSQKTIDNISFRIKEYFNF